MDHIAVDHRSPPEVKIALFRSLFRGREVVYPRRFESRTTGKSGYSPACGNEWLRGICEKPRVKCADCLHQQFLPVTDEVIRWHLSGRDARGADFVAGVYPMLLDESCFFLAIDFDKASWQEDTLAVLATCERYNLSASLERSRSGNGGHIWMFFEIPIPAAMARTLGSHILTETMEHRPEIGLDSYDRFFPNQDTLPRGGFGNLIALPLQREARKAGNSVFVDRQLAPHADQWRFLSSVKRIARTTIEEIDQDARQRGRVVGVRIVPIEEDNSERATGKLDVAIIQSLVRNDVVNDCIGDYGHVIIDECHHLSARSFELVARRAKAKYVTGLSATITRKDGHHPIIFMQCGPVRYQNDAKTAAIDRPFHHTVHVRPTSFRPVAEADPDGNVTGDCRPISFECRAVDSV